VNIHLKGAFGVESTAYEAKRRKKVALDIWYHPYIVRAALIEVDIVNAVWSRAPSTVLQKEQVDQKGVHAENTFQNEHDLAHAIFSSTGDLWFRLWVNGLKCGCQVGLQLNAGVLAGQLHWHFRYTGGPGHTTTWTNTQLDYRGIFANVRTIVDNVDSREFKSREVAQRQKQCN